MDHLHSDHLSPASIYSATAFFGTQTFTLAFIPIIMSFLVNGMVNIKDFMNNVIIN